MSSPEINSAAPSLSDAINKLMANPEIISTVASALGNMKTQSKETSTEKGSDAESVPRRGENEKAEDTSAQVSAIPDVGELVKSLAPMMSRMNGGSSAPHSRRETDKREALLCALKPYVSEGRREAIDYIIRISQVSDILKNIQH